MFSAEIAAGALTGLVVGLTGVGGGALMTPILILLFGVTPMTAVGTDLWFAGLTKIFAVGVFQRHRVVDWTLVRLLGAGSVPAAVLTSVALLLFGQQLRSFNWLRELIALVVCISGTMMLMQLRYWSATSVRGAWTQNVPHIAPAIALGAVVGILTTLTSIGAGVVGTVVLVHFYSTRLDTRSVIGTDTAHAIVLAFVAGSAQLLLGNVNFTLLWHLLLGSIPAVLVGSLLSVSIPQRLLRGALAVLLIIIGLRLM